jgi:hypothetical protein
MSKPYYIIVFLVLLVGQSVAQPPDWVDEARRKQNYPAEKFLVGFAAEAKALESPKLMDRLQTWAKSELIETIQVSIQSRTILNERERGEELQQSFFFESSSFSEADIFGLQTETYFDKKSRKAFAFAYVKKEKVIRYNKDAVTVGFTNTESHLANASAKVISDNLDAAIAEAFAAAESLREIKKAQLLLTALGERDELIQETTRFQKNQNALADLLNTILISDRLSLQNWVSYFSKNMNQNFLGQKQAKIFIKTFTFLGYSFTSPLSQALAQNFSNEISKLENLTLVADSIAADYMVSGTFHDEEENLKIDVSLVGKKGGIQQMSGEVPLASLRAHGIAYLPEVIQKCRVASAWQWVAERKVIEVRCNDVINYNYKIRPTGGSKTGENIPVSFTLNGSLSTAATVVTDRNGEAAYTLVAVRSPAKHQVLTSQVDLARYLSIDTASVDFKQLRKETKLSVAVLKIEVIGGNVLYCSSREQNLGKELTSPYLLEGALDVLTKLGFEFTSTRAEADYVLDIEADTRAGSSFEELYFSYLDAAVSLTDQGKRKKVFSTQFKDIKGAGTNFEGAGIRAYSLGIKKIQDVLISYFNR